MIELRDVQVTAGEFALRDASMVVPDGQYGVIIGTAGAGKTTLLEAIAGIRVTRAGTVRLGGRDVTALAPEERGVGMVYQHDYLFPHLDAGDNVRYGAASESASHEAAALTGVEPLLGRDVHTLSGGERQLVSLARALATQPRFLLLDEPFVALDPPRRAATRRMLRTLQRERGMTVLHVTHDVAEGALLGDVVAVLDAGRVLQTGAAPDVFSRPVSPRVAELLGAENVIAGNASQTSDGLVAITASGLTLFAVADDIKGSGTGEARAASVSGPVHAVIRADEIVLSRTAGPSSARNSFSATITAIGAGIAQRRIELDVSGTPLVAIVTASATAELQLAPGAKVTASFKATAVHLC
jgi:molybdate/tungstate transport system ATP-binding protein